jgi:hypothetical protein
MSNQFIRKASLIVSTGGAGIDLSQFHFRFNVQAADTQSPNNASIRVYNIDPDTVNRIVAKGEFQTVTLQAGYTQGGAYGIVFQGTLKQFRVGKESNTETYLDLLAADGDIAYNFGVVNQAFAAGSTPQDHVQAAATAMGLPVNPAAPLSGFGGIQNVRGKVLFGMAKDVLRSTAERLSASWSIQNGQIQVIPFTGYLEGQPVVLSQFTGVVGVPEATDEGIKIQILLNPNIKIGGRVQIAEALINQTLFQKGVAPVPYNQYTGFQFVANTSRDGTYRVYCIEHEGDTRGQPWYSHLICLATDPSSQKVITTPGP